MIHDIYEIILTTIFSYQIDILILCRSNNYRRVLTKHFNLSSQNILLNIIAQLRQLRLLLYRHSCSATGECGSGVFLD